MMLSKNEGNLLQDFIWQTTQFDPSVVSTPGQPVDKQTAKQHGEKGLQGLKTLGTLLITNGQFRKLLQDVTTLARDMTADAATNVANKARPSGDALASLDEPAQDNTWHDAPDFSKENLKKQAQGVYKGNPKEDAKAAAATGTSTAHPTGSTDPNDLARAGVRDQTQGTSSGVDALGGANNAASTLKQRVDANIDDDTKEDAKNTAKAYRARTREYLKKKVPQDRREQTVYRLKVRQQLTSVS